MLYKDYPEFKSLISSDGKERRLMTNVFEKLSVFTDKKINDSDIAIWGVIKNKRVIRYIPIKYLEISNKNNLDYWKVLVPKANGSGAIGEVLSTPLIGSPLIGYTHTFIGIGAFSEKSQAEACLKYVKSKFARTMLGILKVTQDNPPDKWKYVPLQDFTDKSDIDWNKSVKEIDRQLYLKYGLDEREISFIESKVKEMV